MADNITLNSGSGGATLATDQRSSGAMEHYQLVKLAFGPLDTFTLVEDSATGGLPVELVAENLAGNLDINVAASAINLNVDIAEQSLAAVTVTDDGSFTLAANGGTTIGDVNVVDVIPGTGATNLGKIEDAAHTSGDVGVMSLTVRRDADTSPVTTDGDYAPLITNATGYLKVEIFDGGETHTVAGTVTANAGTGTFTVTDDGSFTLAANGGTTIGDVNVIDVIPGTAATSLGKTEDAAHTTGDVGVMSLAVRRDADTTFVGTDGDYAPLQVNSVGALKVEIFDGGDSHTINGTVTVTHPQLGGGTESGAQRVTIANDSTGTLTVDGTVDAVGNVAHDAVDSGNPVKIGGIARTANPTAVAALDRVDGYFDELGRLVTRAYAPRDETGFQHTTITSDVSETTIVTAGAAGVFRDLTLLTLSNESATECRVDIADSTAGADVMSIDLAADGGGAVIPFIVPFKQTTAANNWTATCSASVASIYITAVYVEDV